MSLKLTLPQDPLVLAFNSLLKGSGGTSKTVTTNENTSNEPKASEQKSSNKVQAMSIIAEGTVIEGKVKFAQSARLDGRIEGEVTCENKLVMGVKSKIRGTLSAESATIEGMVEGEIQVSGTVHLRDNAKVKGKIYAQKLKVDTGAIVDGEFHIGKSKDQEKKKVVIRHEGNPQAKVEE